MAITNGLAWKHWQRVISLWPKDSLRPQEVSFQTLMNKRLSAYENPAKATVPKVKGNAANVQPVDLTWHESKELNQTNALYALLDNRLSEKYPLPASLRKPASQPDHYDLVISETEKAPSRGFFERLVLKYKNMVKLR